MRCLPLSCFRYRPLPRAVRVGPGWRSFRRRTGLPPEDRKLGRVCVMNRRDLLKAGIAAGTIGFALRPASAEVNFSPAPKGWRTFVLTAKVEPTFATKAWIPLPTFADDDWQRPGATSWTGNAKRVDRVRDPRYGAEMLVVDWAADQQNPTIEVTTQVQAQNRSVRLGQA